MPSFYLSISRKEISNMLTDRQNAGVTVQIEENNWYTQGMAMAD